MYQRKNRLYRRFFLRMLTGSKSGSGLGMREVYKGLCIKSSIIVHLASVGDTFQLPQLLFCFSDVLLQEGERRDATKRLMRTEVVVVADDGVKDASAFFS